jgi:transmembrane sensor
MAPTSYYTQLLAAWLDNSLPADQAHELFDFIRDQPELADETLRSAGGEDYIHRVAAMEGPDNDTRDRMRRRLIMAIQDPKGKRAIRGGFRWWAAAAAILLFLAGLALFTWLRSHTEKSLSNPQILVDIAPGGKKATLTLAGGQKILLDSAANGLLAEQGHTRIDKSAEGRLAYNAGVATGPMIYNTLSTPLGGFYQLRLPDGSKVWLNAASSISYPVAFRGQDRSVSVSGEAYFAVVSDRSMPFVVHTPRSAITVLGTEFNVNSYPDEQEIRTTLISGAVKVSTSTKDEPTAEKILYPGQQSVFDPLTGTLVVGEANVQQAIAWKNGQFEFGHAGLAVIMRQISRWYDVDIAYETHQYDTLSFGGGISRNLDLSNVLRLLETNGVHFKIVAKKIIIIP